MPFNSSIPQFVFILRFSSFFKVSSSEVIFIFDLVFILQDVFIRCIDMHKKLSSFTQSEEGVKNTLKGEYALLGHTDFIL